MKITDLNGQQIEVRDFAAALEQAAFFKDCKHDPPNPVVDKRQQAYWTDMYVKLINLNHNAYEQSGK